MIFRYPQEFRWFVSDLFDVQKKKMEDILPIARAKFPEFAERLTVKALYDAARSVRSASNSVKRRSRKGLKSMDSMLATTYTKLPEKRTSKWKHKLSAEAIESARELRKSGYKWQTIVEKLYKKYPDQKIPSAAPLSVIARGALVPVGSKNGRTCKVTITAPTGTVLNMEISSKKAEQMIKDLFLGA